MHKWSRLERLALDLADTAAGRLEAEASRIRNDAVEAVFEDLGILEQDPQIVRDERGEAVGVMYGREDPPKTDAPAAAPENKEASMKPSSLSVAVPMVPEVVDTQSLT